MEKLQNQFEKEFAHNCVDIKISIFFLLLSKPNFIPNFTFEIEMMMMKLFPRTQIDQILQELTQRDTKINLVDYFTKTPKKKRC